MGKRRAGRRQGPDLFFRHAQQNHLTVRPSAFVFSAGGSPNVGMGTALTILLVFAQATSVAAQVTSCAPPPGSYLKTCHVKGEPYTSSDPNLPTLCRVTLGCATVSGERITTVLHMSPLLLKGCIGFLENCNGKPVMRTDGTRHCTTEQTAIEEGKTRRLEL